MNEFIEHWGSVSGDDLLYSSDASWWLIVGCVGLFRAITNSFPNNSLSSKNRFIVALIFFSFITSPFYAVIKGHFYVDGKILISVPSRTLGMLYHPIDLWLFLFILPVMSVFLFVLSKIPALRQRRETVRDVEASQDDEADSHRK
jgi:hypothetical protein